MKKILALFIFIVLIFSACTKSDYVEINNKKIKIIDVAKTPDKSYLGLSFRESICDNCGMLFEFDDKKQRSFVMRDMMFPLDIIWINDDEVIGVHKNLAPEGHETENIYSSPSVANRVLEVNSGLSDEYGIKAGDKLEYFLNTEKK